VFSDFILTFSDYFYAPNGFVKKPSAVTCWSLGMSEWRLAIEKGLTWDFSLATSSSGTRF